MHAMRAGIHIALGSSPGALVFNRDMFLNIPLIADWHAITLKQEPLIHENLLHKNRKEDDMTMYLNNVFSRNVGNLAN